MLSEIITDRWTSPSEEQVMEVEGEFGVQIPLELRTLLSECNGGEFSTWLRRPSLPLRQTPSTLLSIGREEMPWLDMAAYIRIHQGRIPENRIPFAIAGENHFQLNIDNGSVELWIRGQELSLDAAANANPICSGLRDFLNALELKTMEERIDDPWFQGEPLVEAQAATNDATGFAESLSRGAYDKRGLRGLLELACEQHSSDVCYIAIDWLVKKTRFSCVKETNFYDSVDAVVRVIELGAATSDLRDRDQSKTARATAMAWSKRNKAGLAW